MLFRRGAMGRYCRILLVLTVCSTTVSTILLVRLWRLGPTGGMSGEGKDGADFGGHGGFVAGLFAKDMKTVDPFEKEFRGADRMPPSIEAMEEGRKRKSHTGDALLDYYLTMFVDGREIRWRNEVNSRGTLMESLKDYSVMMLEADVRVRWVDGIQRRNGTAVLGFPSAPTTPDITLSEWLSIVSRYSNKGVKLNFASPQDAMYGIPVITNRRGSLHAPVWLHADVLPGPNSEVVSLNHEDFVKMTKSSLLPRLSLSLGWTTAWSPDAHQKSYTWVNAIAMAKVCAAVKVPVSFAVRAVFAASSTRQLKWLLSLSRRFTVTLWMDKYDIVSIPELVYFRQTMDAQKIFYNLPADLLENLKRVSRPTPKKDPSESNGGSSWIRNDWVPTLIHDNSIAFLGSGQAVLDGPGSWLISAGAYKAEMRKSRTVVVSGRVQFITAATRSPGAAGVFVYVRSSGVNPADPGRVQGVKLSIHPNGSLSMSTSNLKRAGAFRLYSSASLPASNCYDFQLIDKGDGYPLHSVVTFAECAPAVGEAAAAALKPPSVELHLNVPYEAEQQQFYVAVNGGGLDNSLVIDRLSVNDKL